MKKTLINRTKSIFTPQPGDFFFLLLFIFVAVRGQTLLMDGDTSLHIRAGQVILSTHGFPKENIFSFVPNLKWGPYEWLSQTLTALIYGWSGFAGVIIFFSFLIAWVHSLVFEDLRKRTYPLAAILLMGLMLFNSRLHWLARPHIFSLLFYWVFYRVLEKYQNENTNKLYFLPLLMILWVNVHAGFVLGTAFIAIYITGNLWRALQNQSERNRHLEKAKVFALTFFACAVAASINPDGFYMLVFPFELLSKIFNNIRELVSPDFHAFPAFGVYLILMTITFAFSSASMNIFQLLFLILALHISLSSIRHIPTAVLITVPIWAEQTKSLIDTQLPALRPFFQKQPAKTSKKSELTSWIWKAVGIAIVALLAWGHMVPSKLDAKKHPIQAVEFLRMETVPGNGFIDDDFGDYLIFALWPKYKVFMDGRSDVYALYGAKVFKDYVTIYGLDPNWESLLEKYGMTWAFVPANGGLAVLFNTSPRWKLIYADKVANIFVKDTQENQNLIKKYSDARLI